MQLVTIQRTIWLGLLSLFTGLASGHAQPATPFPWADSEDLDQLRFQAYTPQDGLPSRRATRCYQDRRGFVWVGTEEGLARFDGVSFYAYYHHSQDPHSLSHNYVTAMTEDQQGLLWLTTFSGGLNCYDPQTERFTHFPNPWADTTRLSSERLQCLYYDSAQQCLWLGGIRTGLLRFDLRTRRYEKHFLLDEPSIDWRNANSIYQIIPDPLQPGRLWLATFGKLYSLQTQDERLTHHVAASEAVDNMAIHALVVENAQTLWLGTWAHGLIRYDLARQSGKRYYPHPNEKLPGRNNIVLALLRKSATQLWVSDYHLGLGLFDLQTRQFSFPGRQAHGLDPVPAKRISDIYQAPDGHLWLTSHSGIFQLDPQQHRFQGPSGPAKVFRDWAMAPDSSCILASLEGPESIVRYDLDFNEQAQFPFRGPHSGRHPNLTTVLFTQNGRCFTTEKNRLYELDRSTGRYQPVMPEAFARLHPQPNAFLYAYEDRQGHLWLSGTRNSLVRVNLKTGTLKHFVRSPQHPTYPPLQAWVGRVIEDSIGRIWLPTRAGLGIYEPACDTFRWLTRRNAPLIDAYAHDLLMGEEGWLWLATSHGVQALDPCSLNSQQVFTRENGLPANRVHSLAPAPNGGFWMGTFEGLALYPGPKQPIQTVSQADGLPYTPFAEVKTVGSWVISGQGEELNFFQQDQVEAATALPTVFWEKLSINGQEWPQASLNAPQPSLRLAHDQNQVSLSFSAPHFHRPESLMFRYRLAGYDQRWRELNGGNHEISYSQLPPGSYRLEVQAIHAAEVGPLRELQLTIASPWWATAWAYGFYALALTGLLYAFYRFQLDRQLARQEARQAREMEALRTQLYANVTHEFRTPITVILGMVEQIQAQPEAWLSAGLKLIHRNGHRLLSLVNQLLDLSRLEGGHLPLHMARGDFVAFLRYLTLTFQPYAEAKQIALSFHSVPEQLEMDFDPQHLEAIATNLLSNALKFTPPGGHIRVSLDADDEQCRWQVEDSGLGIAAAELPHVFSRYYQAATRESRVAEGSGIGLALTRELVEWLGGRIEARSAEGVGTTFEVRLPIRREAEPHPWLAVAEAPLADPAPAPPDPADENETQPLALIIEDQPDVATYLRAYLQSSYRVVVVSDGHRGLAQAWELVPDVIICDVMLPGKNGFEVCRALKQDLRSSHIPILMLTARADQAGRQAGLEAGADAYLVKPFQREELSLRLRKLIELRRRLAATYQRMQHQGLDQAADLDPEMQFLQQLEEIVQAHLHEPGFRVEPDLCRAIGMSRPQLFRKLKALTGQSPSAYLRQLRLREAQRLLQAGPHNVSEVAARVGFQDPSYFTKAYRKAFGVAPSEVQKD